MIEIKKILVPTDFSACSERALEYAILLAEKFGAEIHLLHVVQELSLFIPEAVLDTAPMTAPVEDLRQGALAALKRTAEKFPQRPMITEIAEGAAHGQIVQFAQDRKMDLIVMGTHGHTGLTHVLLGSVAEKVVRTSTCPVLTTHHA